MTPNTSSRTICIVPDCKNDSNSGFDFFRVPVSGTVVFKKWTNFMVLSGNRTERICASHFNDTDFLNHSRIMLRHDAVPTLKLPAVEPFYKTSGICCIRGCKSKGVGLLSPFPSNQHYRGRWLTVLNMPKNAVTAWMRICERHFTTKSFVTVNSKYLKSHAIPSKRVKRIAQKPRQNNSYPSTEGVDAESAHVTTKARSHRMCSVYKCSSRAGKGVYLHSFPPKTDPRYAQWIHNLKQGKVPSKNYKVCSNHFTPLDYKKGTKRLLESAIPSLQLPSGTVNADLKCEKQQRSIRLAKQEENNAAENFTIISSQFLKTNFLPEPVNTHQDIDSTEINDSAAFEVAIDECEETPDNGTADNGTVSVIIEPKTKSRVANYFSDLLTNDNAVNVWTGVESLELLEQICLYTKMLEDNVYPNNHIMHCTDRVILVLSKLKQNLAFSALAVLFRVHVSTVSRYFNSTIHVLAEVLSVFIELTPKEEILQNLPMCFRGKFRNVTIILDCTEVPLCALNCLNCRISTYSHYKSRYTAKYLIGVTPAGLISFYSNAYSGKSSDKYIFNSENLIDSLTPHIDEVMTDKGFSIEKELTAKGITLHIPPFLRGSKLSPADAEDNEDIAKARIHVERIIARLKIFSILHDTVDHYIVPHLDEIITVICALVNLSKPILKDDKF